LAHVAVHNGLFALEFDILNVLVRERLLFLGVDLLLFVFVFILGAEAVNLPGSRINVLFLLLLRVFDLFELIRLFH
jgi:hypothetical protein